jgi:mannitol-specific phosphotransferase system IIBC component
VQGVAKHRTAGCSRVETEGETVVKRLGGLAVMAGGGVVGLGWYLLESSPGPGLGILAAGWVLAGIGALLTLRARSGAA